MKKKSIFLFALLLPALLSYGQQRESEGMKYLDENRRPVFRDNILIPDVNGYQVLKCDFHSHTVFSDGQV